MGATEKRIQDFTDQAIRLHPRGAAHVIPRGSTRRKFWEGMVRLVADAEARAVDVLRESDPRTTTELLPEWESDFGLPGPCDELGATTIHRRAALTAKITAQGGQSRAYFIRVALALGYAITITEHPAMVIGRTVGPGGTFDGVFFLPGRLDVLTSVGHWTYTWDVHAPEVSPFFARVGESTTGDPLVEATNVPLECHLEEIKPAHTRIRFFYDAPFTGYSPWETVEPSPALVDVVHPLSLVGI